MDAGQGRKRRPGPLSSNNNFVLAACSVALVTGIFGLALCVDHFLTKKRSGTGPLVLLQDSAEPPAPEPPAAADHSAADAGASAVRPPKKKPKADPRSFQVTTLENGLQVVNVMDPKTLEHAYAVAVQVGSFSDPGDLPGLAHFCEHMLFLGTQKFPAPTGFDEFMSSHGGAFNAYTASEATVYHASVTGNGGAELRSRFADFFGAPLFNETYVMKEVNAINSEHEKNVEDPGARVFEVMNSLANPESPVSRFHTGNLKTLHEDPLKKGIQPVAALKDYYRNDYCPAKMRLVTISSLSLEDQLKGVKQDFGRIPQGPAECSRSPPKSFATPAAWPASRLGKWVIISGRKPAAELWLQFALPDLRTAYNSHPESYLQYTLDYGGVDSLSRVLTDTLGLTTGVDCGVDQSSAGTTLTVVAVLTPDGNRKAARELVLDVMFAYFAKLRHKGVDNELYSSLKTVKKLMWDWAQPQDAAGTVETLSERFLRIPADQLLSGDSVIEKTNGTLVKSLLEKLTPSLMNVAFVTTASEAAMVDGEKGAGEHLVLTEDAQAKFGGKAAPVLSLPFFGVTHVVQPLDDVVPNAAARWSAWLTEDKYKDDELLEEQLAKRFNAAGVDSHGKRILPLPPVALKDVPSELPEDHMHAKAAAAEAPLEEKLFGPRPKKVAFDGRGPTAAPATGAATSATDSAAPSPGPPSLSQEGDAKHEAEVAGRDESLSKPASPDMDVWYRAGWVTTSPRASISMALALYEKPTDPEVPVLDELRLGVYSSLLDEEVTPKLADLYAAGVSSSVSAGTGGLSFAFSGFTPLMPRLVESVMADFTRFNTNDSITHDVRFHRILTELRQRLQDYTDMPVSHAASDRDVLLTKGKFSRAERLAELDKVTKEAASDAVTDLLFSKPLKVMFLAMGNMEEKEATDLLHRIMDQIPRSSTETPEDATLLLSTPVVKLAGPVELRKLNPRPNDPNDVVSVTFQVGVATVRMRPIFSILGTILGNVAFTELRTKQQLGYVVSGNAHQMHNVMVVSVVVQGTAKSADEAEAAIMAVYETQMPKALDDLSEDDLKSHKESFKQGLMLPPNSFEEERGHYSRTVTLGGRCFEERSSILKALESGAVTKEKLKQAWALLMKPGAGKRKKIVVKYFGKDQAATPTRPTKEEVKDLWHKAGVPSESMALLEREYDDTELLTEASSTTRAKLVAASGGFFPTDPQCDFEARTALDEASSSEHEADSGSRAAHERRGSTIARRSETKAGSSEHEADSGSSAAQERRGRTIARRSETKASPNGGERTALVRRATRLKESTSHVLSAHQ